MQIKYGYIGRYILIVDKYFRLFLKDSLKEYDLNSAEGLALLVLYGEEGITQDKIIDELQYDKGVMARTMKALEDKAYVRRVKNPLDNRSSIFFLTEKAKEFKETLISVLKKWHSIISRDIDQESLGVLNSCLKKMSENAMKRGRDSDE